MPSTATVRIPRTEAQPKARVIPIRKAKTRAALTPDTVRTVMQRLLEANANAGVPVTWLMTELRHLGYRVHHSHAAFTLLKRGAGFMLVEDVCYLAETDAHPVRRAPRKAGTP